MRLSAPALFTALACLVVVAASVVGMMVVGAPGQARAHRLDDQRIEALRGLSASLDRYYADRGGLPATLDRLALEQDGVGPASLRDPESGQPYGYRVVASNAFELCATFAAASMDDAAVHWRHEAGRRCFSQTVSKLQMGDRLTL
ncbi:MAG: hypothetical protein JWM33_3407 [Caulobacteraceae bacterium]|nr:hypothetical protein [Caulobacteraceae bacterium]